MDSEEGEQSTEGEVSNVVPNDRTFLQSTWIRCNTILANISNRKFVESKFRYVLLNGTIVWIIYLFSLAI